MLTALLGNGSIIHASKYEADEHGYEIYCIDPSCRAPVIFVEKTERAKEHFKTIGKDASSRHRPGCGFYEPLDIVSAINKTAEYQPTILNSKSVPKHIITLNLRRLDPDYEKRESGVREKKSKDDEEVKVKDTPDQPGTISSMKGIVKLLTSYEPDILASIYINTHSRKLPLSNVVLSPDKAYETLWEGQPIPDFPYFIYGKISRVTRLEKVMYLDFHDPSGDRPFTIVVFEKYYAHFKYKPDEIENKDVLVYGTLRKNDYSGKQKTEIILKTDKFLEFIQRRMQH